MAKKLTTKPFKDNIVGEGRCVVFTNENRVEVISWLNGSLIQLFGQVVKGQPKLKIKTSKGPRVVEVGDTIVKFGTRRNGQIPTFAVVKA